MSAPIRLPAESEAVGVFLAMDAHLAECYPCRRVNVLFDAAVRGGDMAEVRRLSASFCPVMRALALDLERACGAAFGKDGGG